MFRQWLLAEGDACPDRVPGTFDWHELKPEDPRPNGNAGDYVYWCISHLPSSLATPCVLVLNALWPCAAPRRGPLRPAFPPASRSSCRSAPVEPTSSCWQRAGAPSSRCSCFKGGPSRARGRTLHRHSMASGPAGPRPFMTYLIRASRRRFSLSEGKATARPTGRERLLKGDRHFQKSDTPCLPNPRSVASVPGRHPARLELQTRRRKLTWGTELGNIFIVNADNGDQLARRTLIMGVGAP
jgi:hypothetical protein